MKESRPLTAETLIERGFVYTGSGEQLPLHSHTSLAQCRYLQGLVHELRPCRSLELGLAYGVSTLALCEALREIGARAHVVVDKNQHAYWDGIGLRHIELGGHAELVEFHEEAAQRLLPRLLDQGISFDFAYIDAAKHFDVSMVNAFYVGELLRIGGFMVVDDCDFPSLRRLVRYLAQHPWYEVHSSHGGAQSPSWKRRAAQWLARLPYARQIFRTELRTPDSALGIDAHCVCLRKVSDVDRKWDWHVDF